MTKDERVRLRSIDEDRSLQSESDSSTVKCSNTRRVTLSPGRKETTMADAEESEEMTTLMELFSGVLNRAPVEQHKFLCASLMVCTNQVKNGYQNAFQEASLNDVYPGRFDGFNFAYATELITNIVGRDEEGLLQKRVLGLPATMQDNESRVHGDTVTRFRN